LAIVFVPGLIGVEASLLGQQLEEFSIGLGEGLAGFVQEFGDIATRDFDADHVLEKIPNPAVGSMDFTLEIDRQAREPRAFDLPGFSLVLSS
jgi:hypothetical protein